MMEMTVFVLCMEALIGAIILLVFVLKDRFDKKKVDYMAKTYKEVSLDLSAETDRLNRKLFEDVATKVKEWIEEMKKEFD